MGTKLIVDVNCVRKYLCLPNGKDMFKFIDIYKIVAFKFFLTATYSKKYILHYSTPLTRIKL